MSGSGSNNVFNKVLQKMSNTKYSTTDLTTTLTPPDSFSDISYDLINEVYSNVDKDLLNEFVNVIKQNGHTDLVITGNIGVGKSTICQLLTTLIELTDKTCEINTYPEYIRLKIDGDLGEMMLKLRSEKQISVETFQHFILDFWYMILSVKDHRTKHLSIYERLPEDSVYCFAQRSYQNGEINEDGWMRLQNRYGEIRNDFNIFEKSDCSVYRVSNETNLYQTLNNIMKLIIDHIKDKKLYIILEVKPTIYQQRIKIRNRDSEQSLSTAILEQYGSFY